MAHFRVIHIRDSPVLSPIRGPATLTFLKVLPPHPSIRVKFGARSVERSDVVRHMVRVGEEASNHKRKYLCVLSHVLHAWERNVCKVQMGKPEGKRPLGRPRRRWEDGIRIDLREICWGSVEWIQLAQDRDRWRALVNTVMILRVLAPRS
jgi:hypothetical protein